MSKKALKNKISQPSMTRVSLSRTLIAWFMALAMIPMLLVSWISYQQAHKSLSQAAHEKLEQSSATKVAFINNWFTYRIMDLKNQAEDPHHVAFLMALRKEMLDSGKSPAEYTKSYAWASQVDNEQKNLISMTRIYDYIYDLFLIDTEGNILFTVARESDLGTNLFTGPMANTLFAKSAKLTLKTGQARFSDIERYSPSNNKLAGFLTAP